MSGKKKAVVMIVCLILCLAAEVTFAWYLKEDAKRAETEEAVVMAPYHLYLLGPNGKDSLQFAVGSLHPGETKRTVICVSNQRPEDKEDDGMDMAGLAKDSEFGYDLMLVHTENLAVDYDIYPLERHNRDGHTLGEDDIVMEEEEAYYWTKKAGKLSGSDISEDMRKRVFGEENIDSVVNKGTYWLSADDTMQLAYKNDSHEYESDYYMIEMKWKDIANFVDYQKETDLVYVVANAKQPRPVEK